MGKKNKQFKHKRQRHFKNVTVKDTNNMNDLGIVTLHQGYDSSSEL